MDSYESTPLSKVQSIDSILSPDNDDNNYQQGKQPYHHHQQYNHGHFMISATDIDVNKSLENILLDAPLNPEGDTNSLTSRNESLINFHIFDEEGDNVGQIAKVKEEIQTENAMVKSSESLIELNGNNSNDEIPNDNQQFDDSAKNSNNNKNDLEESEYFSILNDSTSFIAVEDSVNSTENNQKDNNNIITTKNNTSASEEPINVDFIQDKGFKPPNKLITTDSTKCLMKFFTDTPNNSSASAIIDIEGKNFFDQFTVTQIESDDNNNEIKTDVDPNNLRASISNNNSKNGEENNDKVEPVINREEASLDDDGLVTNTFRTPVFRNDDVDSSVQQQQQHQQNMMEILQAQISSPSASNKSNQLSDNNEHDSTPPQQHNQQHQPLVLTSTPVSASPLAIDTNVTNELCNMATSTATLITTSFSTFPTIASTFQTPMTTPVTLSSTSSSPPAATTTTITSTPLDRSYDAWLPMETTSQMLKTICNNGPNVVVPCPMDQLTMPGIIIEETLGDPIRDLIQKHIGEQEALKRLVLNVDSVPQDAAGLQQLIKANSLRAAVDLTGRLLTNCGQGPRRANHISTNTPYSLQLWFVRLSLLARLNLYGPAECEWEPFGILDNPDMYYEFYQATYPNRKGSMVPFEMRILYAEVPQHLGRCQQSLDRLYYMLAIVNKIQENLSLGCSEYGERCDELSEEERKECRFIWNGRETRVLYCIANCLLNMKDYFNCLSTYELLLRKDGEHACHIHAAMGRVYLQLGDVERAEREFSLIGPSQFQVEAEYNSMRIFNKGLTDMSLSKYLDAYNSFKHLVDLDKNNLMALNNMCVCALYLGRLKEALRQFELIIYTSPKIFLQEVVVLNLCTLYELESSKASIKKQNLLRLIGQHRGTGFNVSCLKLA